MYARKQGGPFLFLPALAALSLLLTSALAAQTTATVLIERDYNTDRETNGTFVFDTVPSNSSKDLAQGRSFAILAGSANRNSGPISVLTDGTAQKNWDSVPESFFATDDNTNIRLQVKLAAPQRLCQINVFSWHRNSRAGQDIKIYGALAPTNNAPNYTAAAFRDDAALARLGYRPIATINTFPQNAGQTGVSVRGTLGFYSYILFDVAPHQIANVQRATFLGEIDIFASCPTLRADTLDVSLSAAGKQTLSLDAGTQHARRGYLVLGSLGGTSPNIDLGNGVRLPLQLDAYLLNVTLAFPNSPLLTQSFGALDAMGRATATWNALPILPRSLVGQTFHHAYVLVAPFDFASKAVPLKLGS